MFKKRAKVVNKDVGPSEPFLIWASGFAYHLANSITKDIRGALWCAKSERIRDHLEPRWITSPPDYRSYEGGDDEEADWSVPVETRTLTNDDIIRMREGGHPVTKDSKKGCLS